MKDSVVILAALRTPFGRFGGIFKDVPATELAGHVLNHFASFIPRDRVEMLTVGCVLSGGLGQAPARQCLAKANWPESISASLVNKVCGSGLYAHYIATLALQSQEMFGPCCVVAGGMENMSRAPYLWPRHHSSSGEILAHDSMVLDGLMDAFSGNSMVEIANITAKNFSISRHEQEVFAIESAERAFQGYTEGFFEREIIPYGDIYRDESLSKVNFKKIPLLSPVSKKGTITPATASALADGAAFTIMARLSSVLSWQLTPLATVKGIVTHSHQPDQFLTAPIIAVRKLLGQLKWTIDEVDFFEINEAFAIAPIMAMKELNIPREKVNRYGGACALGHPLGATGARLVVTLTHILNAHQARRGVAALCIGGGEGMAIALERWTES